ncbi:LuxR C-terminal-related transcriptional regulator [Streptomyces sp. NPDC059688]|uniref:LuxR C-terminal-related transcriptional regulator n=1 Tax=Streptomyces sp. NPDC059688 TaxID=3346906 RepID=UPI0036C3DC9C
MVSSGQVILVDDLQLLDAASATLLRQAIDLRQIRLIGTVRSEHTLSDQVCALLHGDGVTRIDLGVLSEGNVGDLLAKTLGSAVSVRAVRALYQKSGGNALYLRELVRGALTSQALHRDRELWELSYDGLPTTGRLSDALESRLGTVSLAGRKALEHLALCEPLSLHDAEAANGYEVLVELEKAELISVRQERQRTIITLAHPLYGELLRNKMPQLAKRSILLDQVEKLRQHGLRRREDALAVASWQLAAEGRADPQLLMNAAQQARNAKDYAQVVELVEALPAEGRTWGVQALLAESYLQMGQTQLAEAAIVDAEKLTTSESEVITTTLIRTWIMQYGNLRVDRILDISNAARLRAPSSESQRILDVNEAMFRVLYEDPRSALPVLETLSPDVGHDEPNTWARGAVLLTDALAITGRTEDAVAWGQRAYETTKGIIADLIPDAANHLSTLCVALTEAGKPDEAAATGEQGFWDLAEDNGASRAWAAAHTARAHWVAGRPASARKWYAQALTLARRHNFAQILPLLLAGLAAAESAQGNLAAAEGALMEAERHPGTVLLRGEEILGKAWYEACSGNRPRARDILHKGALRARETGHRSSESLLLTDLARFGYARQAVDRMQEIAEECQGPLHQTRAQLVQALAESNAEKLSSAAASLTNIGVRLIAAEAEHTASQLWIKAGNARRATAAGQRAATILADCEEARTPILAVTPTVVTLSRRELEIGELASRGRSAKEIAELLHLSARTVNNHLQRIYTKLGINSRKQLASFLAGRN